MNRFLILIVLTVFLLLSCRSTPRSAEVSRPETEPSVTAEEIRAAESAALAEQRESRIETLIQEMSDEEKVGQLFILAVRHTAYGKPAVKMDSYLVSFMERYKPGGIILFSINYETPDQTKALISSLQEHSRLPLFICTDEEGGKVSRLGRKEAMEVYPLPPAGIIGSLNDPDISEEAAYTLGLDLKELGFNVDMAPCADVSREGAGGRVIGNRSFSSDPDTAGLMTAAAVRGFTRAGIASVVKHFPGHGNVSGDSHNGFVRSLSGGDEFRSVDFIPFKRGIEAGVPFLMMGHIAAPSLTGDDTPASLSPLLQQEFVRKELGFEGLIITDAMDMGAIKNNYSAGEAAVQAINAGIDIILMPENPQHARDAVLTALDEGRISRDRLDASLRRILKLKMENLILPNPANEAETSSASDKLSRHQKLNDLLIN